MTQYDKHSHMKRPISHCWAHLAPYVYPEPQNLQPLSRHKRADTGAGSVPAQRPWLQSHRLGHTDIRVRQAQLLARQLGSL